MREPWLAVIALSLAFVGTGRTLVAGQTQDPIVHKTGSNVVPIYEGWYRNGDGTLALSFGYLNRNYEEELEIPVGPANRFEPGPADQGQPSHFYPRRRRGVFVVTVPKDTGNKTVIWTLTVRGQTASVPANLGDLYNIDALRSEGRERVPPGVKLDPAGSVGVGPGGTRTTLRAVFPDPVTLDVWLVNTEASRTQSVGRTSAERRSVTLTWTKYRGPGAVTFNNPTLTANTTDKATTSAAFGEPGEYVLRVLVMGDEMKDPTAQTNQCCWTNAYVQVNVQAAGQSR